MQAPARMCGVIHGHQTQNTERGGREHRSPTWSGVHGCPRSWSPGLQSVLCVKDFLMRREVSWGRQSTVTSAGQQARPSASHPTPSHSAAEQGDAGWDLSVHCVLWYSGLSRLCLVRSGPRKLGTDLEASWLEGQTAGQCILCVVCLLTVVLGTELRGFSLSCSTSPSLKFY